MALPQILTVFLMAIAVGVSIARHGELRPVDAHDTLTGAAIWLVLLFWGGFFN